jgi:hypothetical protein
MLETNTLLTRLRDILTIAESTGAHQVTVDVTDIHVILEALNPIDQEELESYLLTRLRKRSVPLSDGDRQTLSQAAQDITGFIKTHQTNQMFLKLVELI